MRGGKGLPNDQERIDLLAVERGEVLDEAEQGRADIAATTLPLARAGGRRHHGVMIHGVFPVTTLKYLVLIACSACWVYAAYYGVIFEGRLKTKDFREIEALNHPSTVFSRDLPKRALEARRKVFAALVIFAVLGLCLVVILYFDAAGPLRSPFLFHDKLG